MKTTECGEKKASRQCWECLKRRLVCDHTLPGCKKCRKAGKECPGYDDQKPLQWIQPGKVTSRRRKKDSPPKVYTVPIRESSKRDLQEAEQVPAPPAAPPLANLSPDRLLNQSLVWVWGLSKEQEWGYITEDYEEQFSQEVVCDSESPSDILDHVFTLSTRSELEYIVSNRLHDQAARLIKCKDQPLQRLEQLVRVMHMHDVPDYGRLTNETSEVVQAVNYFNARIQPMVMMSSKMAPNPAIIHFPVSALYALPPAVHHTLVCLSLNHYVHSLPIGVGKGAVAAHRSKIYHHRGDAIRALSEYMRKDKTRCSDFAISSILVFMSMELQNPPMAEWRSHASCLNKLISLRGGLRTLMKESPYLAPTLAVFILIMTTANTCSPAWDQLDLSPNPSQTLTDIEHFYDLLFPYMLCPPTLFLSIVRISHLRQKAASVLFTGDMDPSHILEAHDLLATVESFRPEDWAQPGEFFEEWLLIGTIYQAAIAIHCTMAFQSLTMFQDTLEMGSMRSIHGDRLLDGLRKAIKSPRLINFLMWPLTVAGVEAGYRGEAERYWIGERMGELSRHLGSGGPLKSLAVLKRYWAKGEPGWDECFDKPEVTLVPWLGG